MAGFSVVDIFPASGQAGVPLGVEPYIVLDGLDFDEQSLIDATFLEGPDTDQYVGPGQLELTDGNVSQGDMDDFLQSPGYAGVARGTVTVSGIDGDTRVTFSPTYALAPLTDYVFNLNGIQDASGTDLDGYFTVPFTTGGGSVIAVPSTSSSTVLTGTTSESSAGASIPLAVVKATPSDNSIDIPVDTDEIVVEFNKSIDPTSAAASVSVKTIPATDHPNATTRSLGDLAVSTQVEGKKLRIKI